MQATTPYGDVPPLPVCAAFIGLLGGCILVTDIYHRIDRHLNRPPQPPCFVINKTCGRCLDVVSDGSYESCLQFLSTLETHFDAEYSVRLDAGPRPHSDKDKGYWDVKMFGQDFLVMRNRGYGLCIWGPKPPADLSGFLQVAAHFGAIEFLTWQQKLVRILQRNSAATTITTGK